LKRISIKVVHDKPNEVCLKNLLYKKTLELKWQFRNINNLTQEV